MSEQPNGREPCREPFIEMKGVEFQAAGQTIIDHVDLTVQKGELLALVGANGAGKSSLLRCMAGEREEDVVQSGPPHAEVVDRDARLVELAEDSEEHLGTTAGRDAEVACT